jgi:hypothetical protein
MGREKETAKERTRIEDEKSHGGITEECKMEIAKNG